MERFKTDVFEINPTTGQTEKAPVAVDIKLPRGFGNIVIKQRVYKVQEVFWSFDEQKAKFYVIDVVRASQVAKLMPKPQGKKLIN